MSPLAWQRADKLSRLHSPTTSYLAEGPVAQGAGLAKTPQTNPFLAPYDCAAECAVQTQVRMAHGSTASAMLKTSLALEPRGHCKGDTTRYSQMKIKGPDNPTSQLLPIRRIKS